MRTLLYRLTSKRKHLPLPKNAVKENGFIFASLTSLFFSFFMLLSSRLFPPQTENLSRHLRKSEIKSPYFPIFALLFSPHFENPQSICDTLIRNINFHFLDTILIISGFPCAFAATLIARINVFAFSSPSAALSESIAQNTYFCS